MPAAFEKARHEKGAKVRTITTGPNKGRLIAILPSGKMVMGDMHAGLHKGG